MATMYFKQGFIEEDLELALNKLSLCDVGAYRFAVRLLADYAATDNIDRAQAIHDTLIGFICGIKHGIRLDKDEDLADIMATAHLALVWADDSVQG